MIIRYVLLALSVTVIASCHKPHHNRQYQMAIWGDTAGAYGDFAFFTENHYQPPGRSIFHVFYSFHRLTNIQTLLSTFDMTRIVAVEFDETFDTDPKCLPDNYDLFMTNVRYIKETYPNVLVWVNTDVFRDSCPINSPLFDIISIDVYWQGIPYARLNKMIANKFPNQRIALIPATFYRVGMDNVDAVNNTLIDYLEYANKHDEVWAVIGWQMPSGYDANNVWWAGFNDVRNQAMRYIWNEYFQGNHL